MPTYENLITSREVSIAIEHVLIAPENTSWTPARIGVPNSIPANFVHLGAVVEDSPQLQLTREKYRLEAGIPRVLQYSVVRAMGGLFTCAFHSNSNRIIKYALGHNVHERVIVGSFGNAVAITSIDNARTRVFVGTTGIGSFTVGDVLAAGTTATELVAGDNEAQVIELNAGGAGWLRFAETGFVLPVTVSHRLARIQYTKLPFGTTRSPNFTVLGVADFLDGSQVVHLFRKANPTGEWTEQIRPDQHVMVAAQWELLAYSSPQTDYTLYTSSELVIGERFFFNK